MSSNLGPPAFARPPLDFPLGLDGCDGSDTDFFLLIASFFAAPLATDEEDELEEELELLSAFGFLAEGSDSLDSLSCFLFLVTVLVSGTSSGSSLSISASGLLPSVNASLIRSRVGLSAMS